MFGVGYSEALIIAVAALVIFGPHRLPELAGQAGRWIREFRKMTSDLTGEFEKTIAEVDDIRDTVRREMKSMMDEVDTVADSVKSDLSGGSGRKASPAKLGSGTAGKTAAKTGTSGTQSAKATAKTPVKATSKPATNGKAALPPATKADPLVDVSMLDDDLLMGPKSSNGNGVASDAASAVDPALARVRQRRVAAGYARRS